MNSGLSGLLAAYQSEKQQHTELVLATVVATHGSTYAKPGARLLITPADTCYGMIGGDFVTRAVLADAKRIFATRETRMLDLDTISTDQIDLALELEPDASLSVYMEFIDCTQPNTLDLLGIGLASGSDSILISICESGLEGCHVGNNTLLVGDTIEKSDLQTEFNDVLLDIAQSVREDDTPAFESCMFGSGSLNAFFDIIRQPVSLLVIGAGPDAVPMISISRQLGWSTTIVDSRSDFTADEALSIADRIITCEPANILTEVDLTKVDAVVLMTHRTDLDTQFLKALKGNTTIKYIGLLGTSRRRETLLEAVSIQPHVSGEKIYAPVGLEIGGKSPELIALSVISEIQAVLSYCHGGHLTATGDLPVHEPAVSEKDLHAIILAAGGSRRFGGIKQLLEFDGKSLLRKAIETATFTLGNRVKLVLGIKPNKLQREASGYDLEIVVNRDWENGVASSVRAGINSLPDSCRAVLVILCDQPLIEGQHLQMLINAWLDDPGKIVACSYNDTTGVPAIFPRQYFDDMLQLQGDRGAKSIIESNSDHVTTIPVAEAGTDINTQEDLIRLLQR